MDFPLFLKILSNALLLAIGMATLLTVAFVIAYFILTRRLTRRMRETVGEMEAMLSRTIDATDSSALAIHAETGTVPPMRIALETTGESFWTEHTLSSQIDDWLLDHSFIHAGDYTIAQLGGEHLRTYVSEDRQLVAAIRHAPGDEEPYVEFCFDLGQGRRGGVSNPPDSTVQLPPEAIGKHFQDQLSNRFELLSQMWLEAKELVDLHEVRRVDPDGMAQFFEEAHAIEMDCRIEQGGVTEDEIRAAFVAQGIEPNEEDVAIIQAEWQEAIQRHLLDFSQRGQDQCDSGQDILIVYNGSPHSYLLSRIRDLYDQFASSTSDTLSDDPPADIGKELSALLEKFSPREAIARLRPLLPAAWRYDLIDQIHSPIEADLYRLPAP